MNTALIKPPINKTILIKEVYNTNDIIKHVLSADSKAYSDTTDFVKSIKFSSILDLSQQLFDLVFYKVKYIEDPLGEQYIKRPSALWASKFGDCKSMALFIGSCFENLGIAYAYRFVSFVPNSKRVTHVYIITHDEKGNEIIIDPVIKKFNYQKPFNYKIDYNMSGLYSVNGVGSPTMLKITPNMSDAEMDLELARQFLEVKKQIAENVSGVGSPIVAEYNATLNGIAKARTALANNDYHTLYAMANGAGVGSIGKGLLKKVLKKAGEGLKKAILAPITMPIKLMLEVGLPKSGDFFLLLYVKDPKLIAKLPAKILKKRKIQEKVADFIVSTIGMKRAHFMTLVRTGVLKKHKMEPEKVIAAMYKGVAGLGDIGIIDDILKLVTEIMGFFKKKGKGAPSEEEMRKGALTKDDAKEIPDIVVKETVKQTNSSGSGDSGSGNGEVFPSGGERKKGIC